jgi:hypothetical protein
MFLLSKESLKSGWGDNERFAAIYVGCVHEELGDPR